MSKIGECEFRKTFRVAYDSVLEQWKVGYEGAQNAFSAHGTKEQAVQVGRGLAQRQQPSRLIIHRLDGSIQTEHTYGTEGLRENRG